MWEEDLVWPLNRASLLSPVTHLKGVPSCHHSSSNSRLSPVVLPLLRMLLGVVTPSPSLSSLAPPRPLPNTCTPEGSLTPLNHHNNSNKVGGHQYQVSLSLASPLSSSGVHHKPSLVDQVSLAR